MRLSSAPHVNSFDSAATPIVSTQVCATKRGSFLFCLYPEQKSAAGKKEFAFESAGGPGSFATTHDTEREVHPVTTASPPNFPHHRPLFKGFVLHEGLLTKDFRGDQQFFAEDGALAGHPTTPAPGSRFPKTPRPGWCPTRMPPPTPTLPPPLPPRQPPLP
ncbi:hypothetical protein ANANG_G00150600 [Anguilla anguilla]|uniref:Uncharacterized protein n=1 Tax=Anguilla anguilla TaxID=7936 RepID=A0A9D3RU03_ANGAN|nr:hypothetical protein ANANG_G00150600 [Anguilla anguilla]